MIDTAKAEKFRKSLHGRLISREDAYYDSARKVWNGMIDKHPEFIVQCIDEDDVVNSVNFVRNNNLPTAVRGGGHNVAGFGTCDDGVVIDLSPMKNVKIDAESQTARVQAGLTWGEFDKSTQAQGLATTGGLISETGIAGFTLGGGFGWLVRKFGLTVDNLLSAEMVLADGKRVTASPKKNPDLFWGIRGGGGNFGIVTSFEFRLHPVGPEVYGGAIFHPVSEAGNLLKFFREWTQTLPDELSAMTAIITAPPEPFIPKELVGTQMIIVALCYTGSKEEGEKAVKPLRDFNSSPVDLVGPIPYLSLQSMFDPTAPRGIHSYWRTQQLHNLSDDTINVIIKEAEKMKSLSPYTALHIHHWEGAVKKTNPDEMAFAHRDSKYVMNIIGFWNEGEDADKHINWVKEFSQAVKPYATGNLYLNFMTDAGEDRVKAAYGAEKYARLVQLKNKYDPNNLFRINQNIRPSAK